nr:PREDICTED: lysine-specific demethylase 5B isoform X1 [Bemisia tabaci]
MSLHSSDYSKQNFSSKKDDLDIHASDLKELGLKRRFPAFHPPPVVPTYEPTGEDFEDPLAYISSIREEAEKYGIVKIKPPSDWWPPFCVQPKSFKFTPRRQRLDELDATARVRSIFANKVAKFWAMHGRSLKTWNRYKVDMYTLYKVVESRNGYDAVTENDNWEAVATELGYINVEQAANYLKGFYRDNLEPFRKFTELKFSGVSQSYKWMPPVQKKQSIVKKLIQEEYAPDIRSDYRLSDIIKPANKNLEKQISSNTSLSNGDKTEDRLNQSFDDSDNESLASKARGRKRNLQDAKGDSSSDDAKIPQKNTRSSSESAIELRTRTSKRRHSKDDSSDTSSNDLNPNGAVKQEVISDDEAKDVIKSPEPVKRRKSLSDSDSSSKDINLDTLKDLGLMSGKKKKSIISLNLNSTPEPRVLTRASKGRSDKRLAVMKMNAVLHKNALEHSENGETDSKKESDDGDISFRSDDDSPKKRDSTDHSSESSPNDSGKKKSSTQKELERLKFKGPGPKMLDLDESATVEPTEAKEGVLIYTCSNCYRTDMQELILTCQTCAVSTHIMCLAYPLPKMPEKSWFCPKCIAKELAATPDAYGFEDTRTAYTLQTFGSMAEDFKRHYFRKPFQFLSSKEIEREYWRILSCLEEPISVEYGADLQTHEHGSGFPTHKLLERVPEEKARKLLDKYTNSNWNLNNMPVLEGSVLKHISANISGMKVPWSYVGMCFSTFCWHNEDHWSYSINYLHWGDYKTWYGVPGSHADEFEAAIQEIAPELFHAQPDLLHQLVTIVNPNDLMERGVPIFRVDQGPGEFVITFPRAYHAGFNQGFNFAEAVNFAPADWITMGRDCISHYSSMRRTNVFSHDELTVKLALIANSLPPGVRAATFEDLKRMIESEKSYLEKVTKKGITKWVKVNHEALSDDHRLCAHCKTTVYLSAISCQCKLGCLRHINDLCNDCPVSKWTLRYQYSVDELFEIYSKLQTTIREFDSWKKTVVQGLKEKPPKYTLKTLITLKKEAIAKNYTFGDVYRLLSKTVSAARSKVKRIAQLREEIKAAKTNGTDEVQFKYDVDGLCELHEEIASVPCVIPEISIIDNMIAKGKSFRRVANATLKKNVSSLNPKLVQELICKGYEIGLNFEEMPKLKSLYEQCCWLDKYSEMMKNPQKMTLEAVESLLRECMKLMVAPEVELALAVLDKHYKNMLSWVNKVDKALKSKNNVEYLQDLWKEGKSVPGCAQTREQLKETLETAQEWLEKYNEAVDCTVLSPFLEELIKLIDDAKDIPVNLEPLSTIKTKVAQTNMWKREMECAFLMQNSQFSLMDIFAPRNKESYVEFCQDTEPAEDVSYPFLFHNVLIQKDVSRDKIIEAYQHLQNEEIVMINKIREENKHKFLNNTSSTKFCFCHEPAKGVMKQCFLCLNWFHNKCITGSSRRKCTLPDEAITWQVDKDKYLCPCCKRSKRPDSDDALAKVTHLQNSGLRCLEAEILYCLLRRSYHWQQKASLLLDTPEIADIVDDISSNMDLRPDDGTATSKLTNDSSEPFNNTSTRSEHTYSAVSKKPVRKSLDHRGNMISDKMRQKLIDLILEGDLMEITAPEMDKLWRVYHETRTGEEEENRHVTPQSQQSDQPVAASRKSNNKVQSEQQASNIKKNTRTPKPSKKKNEAQPQQPKSKPRGRSAKLQNSTNTNEDNDEVDTDEEDECSAGADCCHPTDENINWVQCDGNCRQWFHMACMGVNPEEFENDVDFYCDKCHKERHGGSSSVNLGRENPDLEGNEKLRLANALLSLREGENDIPIIKREPDCIDIV